jgi:hypothetical protein
MRLCHSVAITSGFLETAEDGRRVITVVGGVLDSSVDYLDDLLVKRRCAGWTFRSRR